MAQVAAHSDTHPQRIVLGAAACPTDNDAGAYISTGVAASSATSHALSTTITKTLAQAKEEFLLHPCHSSSKEEGRRLCAHNSFLDRFVDPLDQGVMFPFSCVNF